VTTAPFAWWAIHGAAGAGKSRLTLELAMSVERQWDWGFLWNRDTTAWRDWKPRRQTLIIVDYASRFPEGIVLHMLLALRNSEAARRVRVLLIDRDQAGPKGTCFEQLTTGPHRDLLTALCFDRTPMSLVPLKTEDQWTIVTGNYKSRGAKPPDKESTISALDQLNRDGRPLYAMFAAHALLAGDDIRGWDTDALEEHVLLREMQLWSQAGARKVDHDLVALATLAGGIDAANAAAREEVRAILGDDEFSAKTLALITGRDAVTRIWPLEPDLLGELYLLEYAKRAAGFEDWRLKRLVRAACRIDRDGVINACAGAMVDYAEHPGLVDLVDAGRQEPDDCDEWWTFASQHLIRELAEREQFKESCQVLANELASISRRLGWDRKP
jgi:hypothetical protein